MGLKSGISISPLPPPKEESLFLKLDENPVDYNTLNKLGYVYLHSNNLLKSEEYYSNGQIKRYAIYKDDWEDGKVTEWDSTGKITYEKYWKDKKEVQ